MGKPTKRWLQSHDLLEDAIDGTGQISSASLPSPGSGGVLRGLLPPLFTVKPDNVNFNMFKAGHYDPASYYAALESSDTVVLPLNQANADAIGYDATRTFQAGLGNDTVTGGGLNDLIYGGHGNDRLYGNNGNDALMGGEGHDWLIDAKGNDILWAGNGLDYIDAGAGNDTIVANEDDWRVIPVGERPRGPTGEEYYAEQIYGGAGNDLIFATGLDRVDGGDGNDRIELSSLSRGFGYEEVSGGNGNDVIIGSSSGESIHTGPADLLWSRDAWNPENEAAYGGFTDTVMSGGGDDDIATTYYCNAVVDTGPGDDYIHVFGLQDIISMGDDVDVLRLYGGACKANLGDGDDYFIMDRAAYDNPNVSEITLGAGLDNLIFNVNHWLTEDNHQSLSEAPWILDFDFRLDRIIEIDVMNDDDLTKTLDPRNIFAVNITGGSALIYDDPVDSSTDFCFARFAGVSADQLKANLDTHVDYYPTLP